jgi:hypothetical protein
MSRAQTASNKRNPVSGDMIDVKHRRRRRGDEAAQEPIPLDLRQRLTDRPLEHWERLERVPVGLKRRAAPSCT